MSRFIGIDLGGTKVAAAALSGPAGGASGGGVPARAGGASAGGAVAGGAVAGGAVAGATLSAPIQHPTELSSARALVEQLEGIIAEVRDAHGGELDAVGIGVPSVVDFATGKVVHSVNIPLTDVPLRSVLGERFRVPVYVDNDATVAALAEAHDEQLALVAQHLVMLTIGTGVGGGVVLGGRIYRGAYGGAMEVGHTLVSLPIAPAGPVPDFPANLPNDFPPAGHQMPLPGSLEALASGHALDRLTIEAGLGEHGADAVAAARAGSPEGQAIVRRWAHAIGVGIANAVNLFDPEEVVIGGGAAAAGDLFLASALEFAEGYIHPGLRGHARVRLARFGAEAGVLGAALLAAYEVADAAVVTAPVDA